MNIMKNSGRIVGLALAVHLGVGAAQAAIITLNASDGINASSFNTAGNWSNNQTPSSANDYQVTGTGAINTRILRTPAASTVNVTFAGKSLTVANLGEIVLKHNTGGSITMNNLVMDNGVIKSGNANVNGTVKGIIVVNAGGMRLTAGDSTLRVESAISGAGGVNFWGSYANTVTGVNTYTGNTSIGNTAVTFHSTNQQRFKLEDFDSNYIYGTGTGSAAFNGKFYVDTTALTVTTGTWNLINGALITETWGSTFGLTLNGATNFARVGGGTGAGIYTATSGTQDWSFDTSTGSLSVIPEPGSGMLLVVTATGIALLRRKLRK